MPYPADYGGAIDIYYRIKALHELGYKIILHCWEYGRGEQEKLEEITHEVHYYPRKKAFRFALSRLPFIVISRQSVALFDRLLQDNHPILFEGIHTTLLLDNPRLKERIKIVRMHNVEHDYYDSLARQSSGFKRYFFSKEAKKLKNFEPILKHASAILAISPKDQMHFQTFHPNVFLLNACIPSFNETSGSDQHNYCLYHGNLSVQENESAVVWILKNVMFPELNLIIAGKNPSQKIIALAKEKKVTIIANPSNADMNELVQNAHIHLLYTNQSTGVKLKLVQSLWTKGHVLVNPTMVEGTQLSDLCTVFSSASDCQQKLNYLLQSKLSEMEIQQRRDKLQNEFDAVQNCATIFRHLI